MKKLSKIILLIFLATSLKAQVNFEKDLTDYTNPEEIVTLAQTIPFDQAIEVLSTVSEKLTGKKIVSTAGIATPIGIEITNMPYWKALIIITQYNNLVYEERESVIVVQKKGVSGEGLSEDIYADADSREVNIAAVLFEANVSELKEQGINWEFLLEQNGVAIGSSLLTFSETGADEGSDGGGSGASEVANPEFLLGGATEFTTGSWDGTARGMFKFFETNGLGEIISRPTVTVRDKKQGRIQIGSDISIKQRDFAGNVIDVFYSTGTIIQVTPYIYEEDGLNYILLQIDVERSSAEPGVVSTEIRKTKATTEVLMLDGEQTVIGGLLVNEEIQVRRGIPFLKDLPWWVLGIRYLTGYDQNQIVQKEVIILIEAELVKTLKERVADMKQDKYFQTKQDNHDALQKYLNQRKRFNKENKKDDTAVIKGEKE